MEQNSADWYAWRRQGLGASDAPIVMGVSPYTTRYDLWLDKTGIQPKPDDSGNAWAMRRGHELEPRARAAYEIEHGFIDMPPRCFELERYPFIRASLDGYNEGLRRGLEIKCPGLGDHELAKQGIIPPQYVPQLQQQFLVTGAVEIHYWSYYIYNQRQRDERPEGIKIVVTPDLAYCQRLLDELCAFWELVQAREPPAFVDADFKSVNRKELNALCREYADLADQMAALQVQILTHEDMPSDARVRCQRLRIHQEPGNVSESVITVVPGKK